MSDAGGFDLGGVTDFADVAFDVPVNSFTDGFGTEFLSDLSASLPGIDLSAVSPDMLGGSEVLSSAYEQVGSFAGNASWFDATNFGSIVDSATTGISDFGSSISSGFNSIQQSIGDGLGYLKNQAGDLFGTNLTSAGQILVDDQGYPLLSADISTINAGIAPSLLDKAIDYGTQYGTQVVKQLGVQSISGIVGSAASSVLPGPLGSTVGRIAGQSAGAIAGYGTTGTPGFNVGSILNSTVGFNSGYPTIGGVSLPGITNQSVGSIAGYGTPGIVPTSGFNIGSALNSALSFVSGSGTASAATIPSSLIKTGTQAVSVPGATLTQQINAVAQVNGVSLNTPLTAEQQNIVNTGQQLNSAQNPTNPAPTGGNFTELYNPETGLYDVYNLDTNTVVQSGLTEQEAILAAQDLSIGEPVITLDAVPKPVGYDVGYDDLTGKYVVYNPEGQIVAQGLTEQEAILFAQEQSVYDEGNTPSPVDPIGPILLNTEESLNTEAGTLGGLIQQAQQQQTVRDQRQNKAQSSDWRVRLRLAPKSNYLYNDPQCGPVLWPLRNTDGVIFPYTPNIDTAYKAEYDSYNLTHSNYRGYFYKGSYVDAINIRAMFTAQDTNEANYLLATIHFFRSATKMFYGQDAQRGAPPPLVYLSGLGEFQFNEHPCVISQFNYTLPSDVDYIRAQSANNSGLNLLSRRDRQTIAGNPLSYALQRLSTALPGLTQGAESQRYAGYTLPIEGPTYVPTKMDIQLTLFPIQSRQQVSKQFSLKNFANGNLLKGGFW